MVRSEPHADPVAASIRGFAWSSEESVAYEAAIEAINGAVGAYSARIHAEQCKESPDAGQISRLLDGQGRCARVREGLVPTDRAQIAEVRRHYADLARRLSAEEAS
ncbi:hypothetical protein HYE82_23965 [Streptomyces sp. BR123]|uniref:hypothetical protein n=1 Tax=Streptomyces sp. BR123 TaxID=2749828 RepID=UPI0015C4B747|nr:hypothetical protein [Streptomyces sp. BR123]NXY97374.1 hypothetical protein [Streptomyces sp. BR123]